MRLTDLCPMKLTIIKQFDKASNLLKIFLKMHVNKKLNNSMEQRQHNHTLEFLDDVKINSAIKFVAEQKVTKKYISIVVNKNMQDIKWKENFEILKTANEASFNLKGVHNVNKNFKKLHLNARISGAKKPWCDQLNDCFDILQSMSENVLSAKFEITRNVDEKKSYAIAFAKRFRLSTLMKRGHLILMNSIHNTNQLKWKLFTMMMKNEHENWIFEAHMLIDHENDDIIKTFLRQIKR